MTSPFSRLGSAKRARGVPAERIPPGQYLPRGWPALHYGPVPRFRPESWELRVFGATHAEKRWTWEEFCALPTVELVADFHCVTKFTVLDNEWNGVSTTSLLALAPPDPAATHVMVWAEYGYSTNLPLADFASPEALFATHRGGVPLTPEHGYPLRLVVPHLYAWKGPKWVRGVEYLTEDRAGFWEERGYHNRGDPWAEERYSHQEP